jgi:hypothetical protein
MLMQCIYWGCEHRTPDVYLIALQTTDSMFTNMLQAERGLGNPEQFFRSFYLPMITKLFQILQDSSFKFAFDEEINLLSTLMKI